MRSKNYTKVHDMDSKTWAHFCDVFEHFGVLHKKRCDKGCFLSSNKEKGTLKLVETLSFADKKVRDALADAFLFVAQENSFDRVHVEIKDETKEPEFPYSFSVAVAGDAFSAKEAANEMARFLSAMARHYPAPEKGSSWNRYRAAYRVEDHINWGIAEGHHIGSQIKVFNFISNFYYGAELRVAGEYASKNVKLPVVQLTMPQNATKVTIGDNGKGICVSVDSLFSIQNTRDLNSLFDTTKRSGSFEGFPKGSVYRSYSENPQKFSFSVDDYPTLLMLLGEIFRQDKTADYVPPPRLGKECLLTYEQSESSSAQSPGSRRLLKPSSPSVP